jgi:hypothetical protein
VETGVTGLWSRLLFTSVFNIRGERRIAAAPQLIVACSVADLTPLLLGEVGTTPFFFPFAHLILGGSKYGPLAEAFPDLRKTREPAARGQPCCGQVRRKTTQSLSTPPETR